MAMHGASDARLAKRKVLSRCGAVSMFTSLLMRRACTSGVAEGSQSCFKCQAPEIEHGFWQFKLKLGADWMISGYTHSSTYKVSCRLNAEGFARSEVSEDHLSER